MIGTSIHPRPEQIEVLTQGGALPLPPLAAGHLTLIANTLATTWNGLAEHYGQTFRSGDENEINGLMVGRLKTLCDDDPVWGTLVRSVARGEETPSYDGSHLEKRPDISISLTDQRRSFPLIIECKLIELAKGKTVNLYCDNGVVRFISGDYAWYAREAMMMAYVRDGSTITSSLAPVLSGPQNNRLNPYQVQSPPKVVGSAVLDMACSQHTRHFSYIARHAGQKPSPITVWHLWLRTPKAVVAD